MFFKNKIKLILIYFFLTIIFFQLRIKKCIRKFIKIIDISVIIPIFNGDEFLSICLKSVINQSLKNIEIICIDDGSTDKSLDILIKFKNIDNRIFILHQENQGSAIARNKGIRISKGKFISFMDSDDLYPDNFTLELMFKNAIKNKVLICGGGLINIYQNHKPFLLRDNKTYFNNSGEIEFYNYQYDYFYQRFIYNKNFIKKNNLYFPNYLRYQDPPFFIKAMTLAKKFYSLKNITYFHRSSNKSVILNEKKIIDIYKGIKDCLDFSELMNLNELYCQILTRINAIPIVNNTKKYIKNEKLKFVISQILNNINFDILKKENFSFKINEFYNNLK